jgi:hypothetical protein
VNSLDLGESLLCLSRMCDLASWGEVRVVPVLICLVGIDPTIDRSGKKLIVNQFQIAWQR